MMGYWHLLFFACVACLGLASALPTRNAADCVNNELLRLTGVNVYPSSRQIASTTTQYLQDRTTVQVAQNFEVTYFSTFKVVSAKYYGKEETYLLYQCGTPRPDPVLQGLPGNTKVFSVPLSAVSVEDTTVITFLRLLGVIDRVAYVTPDVVDPCMQLLASEVCGKRIDDAATPDVIDAKFSYGIDASNSQAVMFAATSDPGPLNRAEYIKYIATFFNRENTANTVFTNIFDTYSDIKQAAAEYIKSSGVARPVVAWLYYQPMQNGTYKAPEQVNIKFAAYRKQYTEDAGGRMLDLLRLNATYGDGVTVRAVGSDLVFTDLSTSLAVLRTILKDVDVAIDETHYGDKNPGDITADDFRALFLLNDSAAMTDINFLRDQRLLRLDGVATSTGRTSWYEEAVARPDAVLRDLVAAFLPQAAPLTLSISTTHRLVRSMLTAAPSAGVLTSDMDCQMNSQSCGTNSKAICPAVYLDCAGKLVQATDLVPCAPTCARLGDGSNGGGAGHAVAAPAVLLALLAAALAAVLGWAL